MPGRALGHLARAHQGGQRTRHAFQILRQPLAVLFPALNLFPRIQHLVRRALWRAAVRKNMRMPKDQLFADAGAHVVECKCALLGFHLRMQRYLKQHIAQLLAQKVRVSKIDGVNCLVGFFNKIFADAGVRLHLIPRAAAFRISQEGDDAAQIVHRVVLFCKPAFDLFLHPASTSFLCVRIIYGPSVGIIWGRRTAPGSQKTRFSILHDRALHCKRFLKKTPIFRLLAADAAKTGRSAGYRLPPQAGQNRASASTGAPHCGQ